MHFAFTYDGSGKASDVHFYVDGKPAETDILSDTLNGPVRCDAEMRVGVKEPDAGSFSGALDDVRFYNRVVPAKEIEYVAVEYPVQTVLSGIGGKLTKTEE